jgi:vomeronasal1 receptor
LSTWVTPSFFFFWISNFLISIKSILLTRANRNSTVHLYGFSQASCQSQQLEHNHSIALTGIIVIRDALFVTFMMFTSLYMVQLLYRHHTRAQHVHSPRLSSQLSLKTEHCTKSFCYWVPLSSFIFLHNVIALFTFHKSEQNPHLEKVTGILSLCYPTICPFLLMKNNKVLYTVVSCLLK